MPVINPPRLKTQPFYNHAIVKAGLPVFPTGQVAWDGDGRIVGIGDIEAQVAQVYRNIESLLHGLEARRTDIVKTVTFVTDRAFAAAVHRGRLAFFGDDPLPASTFLVVNGLADPDLLVEIDMVLMLSEQTVLDQTKGVTR